MSSHIPPTSRCQREAGWPAGLADLAAAADSTAQDIYFTTGAEEASTNIFGRTA